MRTLWASGLFWDRGGASGHTAAGHTAEGACQGVGGLRLPALLRVPLHFGPTRLQPGSGLPPRWVLGGTVTFAYQLHWAVLH